MFFQDDALFQCQVGASAGVRGIRSRSASFTGEPPDPVVIAAYLFSSLWLCLSFSRSSSLINCSSPRPYLASIAPHTTITHRRRAREHFCRHCIIKSLWAIPKLKHLINFFSLGFSRLLFSLMRRVRLSRTASQLFRALSKSTDGTAITRDENCNHLTSFRQRDLTIFNCLCRCSASVRKRLKKRPESLFLNDICSSLQKASTTPIFVFELKAFSKLADSKVGKGFLFR